MHQSTQAKKALHLWFITDNKPGHKNQLEGLLQALSEKHPVVPTWIEINKPQYSLASFLSLLLKSKNKIDFCIGAGHKTHLYLILCKLLTNAKSIVLMKPSLPLSWFDLAIIPEHDGSFTATNIIQTKGVINKICHSSQHNENKGLFLIGGPSRHYDWDNQNVIKQIHAITQSQPTIQWTLTTSRRTHEDFISQLQQKKLTIKIIPHTETTANWLPKALEESGQVWVSEDSVSMLYEALTSGANTGLLRVPCRHKGRIQQGIEKLLNNKQLLDFNRWQEQAQFPDNTFHLNEADRIATLILQSNNHDK